MHYISVVSAGHLEPVVDIDIGKGYQENVTLTFLEKNEVVFTHTVNMREPVVSLQTLIFSHISVDRRPVVTWKQWKQ